MRPGNLNYIIPGFFSLLLLLGFNSPLEKSTDDLSFLLGKWEVERIYSPGTEKERSLKGTLVCKKCMDNQFINCVYEIDRPGKSRGLDEVYFNYNKIYDTYESMWLSSTWPIKVLLQGILVKEEEITLSTNAEFQIENNLTEYVKDELKYTASTKTFTRETHVRTSAQKGEDWFHHMTEFATKTKE